MDPAKQVLEAARERAAALAEGDATRLRELLHPEFRWTAHTGASFDRDSYIASNTGGTTVWRAQVLLDPEVVVVENVAVLRCDVSDEIQADEGARTFRMPMTQVWVRSGSTWQCLAGHAGPAKHAEGAA